MRVKTQQKKLSGASSRGPEEGKKGTGTGDFCSSGSAGVCEFV